MAGRRIVLALDQGTTGSTVLAVDESGTVRGRGYREIEQQFPRPGWVEHDPEDIWSSILQATAQALAAAGAGPSDVAAIGITNQRETLVLWNRQTLAPHRRAIVWQDRRTAGLCDRLKADGHEAAVRRITGLVIDPYFTGTKLAWVRAEEGLPEGIAAGTIDSWLVARLTGGLHVSDASNASRTLLLDIDSGSWSDEMLALLEVPAAVLPEVVPSGGEVGVSDPERFGGIRAPIAGIAGDQQAALFGQGCLRPGQAKNTYGTGSFVLLQTGADRVESETGMLTTIAWQRGGSISYALEGAIFVTGAALQWLRDGLGVISAAAEAGPLAESVPDTGGVVLVPAFTGLGAPHWDPYARGAIVGLTRGTTKAHIVRAAVEAMAFQTADVVQAMARDAGRDFAELRVDGGASVMNLLCQLQADLIGVPVRRPKQTETTALGAAYLAGVGTGFWEGDQALEALWQLDREFTPSMPPGERDARLERWHRALERSRDWATDDNL